MTFRIVESCTIGCNLAGLGLRKSTGAARMGVKLQAPAWQAATQLLDHHSFKLVDACFQTYPLRPIGD